MKMLTQALFVLFIVVLLAPLHTIAQSDKRDSRPETPAQELSRLMVSTFVTEQKGDEGLESSIRDRRIALKSDQLVGTWLYYQLNTGESHKLYRQRVIKLTTVDQDTVSQELYTPKNVRAWENVWEKPGLLENASLDDFDASLNKACEQTWTRLGPNKWRGYVDPKKCKIFSERRNKEILIEGESILSLASLKKAERGFSLDGQQIWGSKPEQFNTLVRHHSSSSSVIAFSEPSDWRVPDARNLIRMRLESGDVWLEFAPQFAPKHVENIRSLVAGKYFDDTAVIRSQENYVVQWGDVNADTDRAKDFGKAEKKLEVEFFRNATAAKSELGFFELDSQDAYADQVGLVNGFPVAGDQKQLWLTHCYGMLGVGRGMESDSGNGSSLYLVTGHAPRHLDRNVTLVGRALSGTHHLTTLPRGTGALGFYETEDEHVKIKSVRLGTEVKKPFEYEVMRTDTPTFRKYVKLRTTRLEDWFLEPTGRIGLCNVGVPMRAKGR